MFPSLDNPFHSSRKISKDRIWQISDWRVRGFFDLEIVDWEHVVKTLIGSGRDQLLLLSTGRPPFCHLQCGGVWASRAPAPTPPTGIRTKTLSSPWIQLVLCMFSHILHSNKFCNMECPNCSRYWLIHYSSCASGAGVWREPGAGMLGREEEEAARGGGRRL